MIDLSLAGLLGAMVGTVVAAMVYRSLVLFVERGRHLRGRSVPQQQSAISDLELSLLRRIVLAADIAVFGGLGYWLGEKIGG